MNYVLYLTSRPLDYPGGDATRALSMINLLARKYSRVIVVQNLSRFDASSYDKNITYELPNNVETILFRQKYFEVLLGTLKFLLGKLPLSVCLYYNRRIKRYLLSNSDKLIHVHLSKTLVNVSPRLFQLIYFDYCDLESKKIEKLKYVTLRGILFKMDFKRYKRLEDQMCNFKKVYLINSSEKQMLENKCDVSIIGNYRFEKKRALLNSQKGLEEILFIGNFQTISNRHALEDFLDEVWPVVSESYYLKLAGFVPKELKNRLETDCRIRLTGVYKTIDDIITSESIILVPNSMAGGVQNKLLDGLYTGVITVARDIILKGLDIGDDSVYSFSNNNELVVLLESLKCKSESELLRRRRNLLEEASKIEAHYLEALNLV